MLDKLKNLIASNPINWQSILSRSKNQSIIDLKKWINLKTPLLQDQFYSFATKVYWILNGLNDFPICKFAENEKCGLGLDSKIRRNVDSFKDGYFRACCKDCPTMKNLKQVKLEKSIQNKYGSKNYFSSDLGVKNKKEWCEKHNVTNPFQLESVKEKSKNTRKEHFGCEYTMQSKEKQLLAKKHYFEKTGFEHQFKNPDVQKQIQNTLNKRREDISLNRKLSNRKRRYENFLNNAYVEPNFSKESFSQLTVKTQYTSTLSWKCKKCGNFFDAYLDQNFSSRKGIPARCPICFPIDKQISDSEKELVEYVKSITSCNIIENDRTIIAPLELDIYIPEKKIAIEFDGLYWHNNEIKANNYHLNKTELCEKQGIQLIHIFENEWLYKQDIVKSRLKNLFGIYDKVIYARQCEIKEVSSKESKLFQNDNHIQGSVNSGINIGLFYNDELISLMTFGKCRFNKKYEYELLRFCNKLNYHIPGAASKLLKYFEKIYQPKSLISYADRRWSKGNVYEKLGFNLNHKAGPNYWYFKGLNLESRVKYQKHKLKNILDNFDPNKSEAENMKANRYNRIFDCGNLVYLKEYF